MDQAARRLIAFTKRVTRSIEIDGCGSQEVAHRRNRAVGVEALVFPIGEAHEPLGGPDRCLEPLPWARYITPTIPP